MNKSQLINALEENLKAKFSYIPANMDNMEVIKDSNKLLINSYLMSDMNNIVCSTGMLDDTTIKQTTHYFKQQKLPFAWWVGFECENDTFQKQLQQHGFKRSENELAMTIDLSKIKLPEIPSQLIIKRVDNQQLTNDLINIITAIIPAETEALTTFFIQASPVFCASDSLLNFYVGYINENPVGTCSVFFSKEVAGIFDIITSSQYRGQGIGTAMTTKAMMVAAEKGYDHCILTATDDAKYLYEKLGFFALKNMYVYTI